MSRSVPVVEIISGSSSSRASSTSRSRRGDTLSRKMSTPRLTRNSLRQAEESIIKDSEDDSSVMISSPLVNNTTSMKGKGKAPESRASMSSVSTVNDYGEASDYSTPGTSAVATPAPVAKTELVTRPRRGRRPVSTVTTELPPSALNALQRAKNLRNSAFALNPVDNKRKRAQLDDEEDYDNDDDDSPDAQLARALQEQEDAKANQMVDDDDEDDLSPRRTRRGLRDIMSKASYLVNDSDDEMDKGPATTFKISARRSKRTKYAVQDSDIDSDESEFVLPSDDEDVPLATLSAASRKKSSSQKARGRMSEVVKQQSIAFRQAKDTETDGFIRESTSVSALTSLDSEFEINNSEMPSEAEEDDDSDNSEGPSTLPRRVRGAIARLQRRSEDRMSRRARQDRARLEAHHPELLTMWKDLENLPEIKKVKAEQPVNISRELKPFQLEGLNWMQEMEKREWGGGLLGDEMGMGKTIQAVSLIMSDYPAKDPSLVLIPPVALMQWQQEIGDYTNGLLKTFVFHGTNLKTKSITVDELKKYDVILMSYNSLESMYRHQEKGFKRKDKLHKEASVIHQIKFHRVILDEAHNIKQRTTNSAKACFALKADHKWCLSGTPLQNRIGEFFSLIRFLDIRPFACYFCKQCPCNQLEWSMNSDNRCTGCGHSGMHHVSVFNQELLNPIQKFGNNGPGKLAFEKLRLLTDRFMLRRIKRDHSAAMELPAKEIYVDRQFFGEEENDFAGSIMNNSNRKFETYVAQGVLLNNYANIFGLIMQMRQVADHPDLILKKNGEGGQNIIVCCICDEAAEDAIRSACKHDFCRACVRNYLASSEDAETDLDCPRCHIPLAIDLEQPEIEQNEELVKKSSIINRIKMENWTSSTKIEALVHELYKLRSPNSSTKSIIFSGFTTMLQLVEWRLRRAGITSVMLDGSMTPAQRQASINAFMTNPNIECFLVSLKAGGVALNLTEASKVFIVDPWWNPAAEWQSADRCHRIGQCRPCSITRLCIEDSVESRMVLLQEKKTNMIHSTINNDDSAMESLTPEDMQFLFRGS